MGRRPNTKCGKCGKPIYRRPYDLIRYKSSYCEQCRNNNMPNVAKKKNEMDFKEYIRKWKNGEIDGIRKPYYVSRYIVRYLLIKYDNKCGLCGWNERNVFTAKIPLETHHIDGNHFNNREENLILLCPNCHSLTPTYKGLNKGNGRENRKR